MKSPLALFSEHPAAVGESYFEHLAKAGGFGLRLIAGGLACLVHAVFPFLCVRSGSDCVTSLHDELSSRRRTAEQSLISLRAIGPR
jgi:hypothetical protein